MPKVATLLDQIDAGTVLLPEFQRGYVWNRTQVKNLMRSMYMSYPVGSLLLWETSGQDLLGGGRRADWAKLLLLDGQQRLTTLYGIIRGRPPQFFDGDPNLFEGLHFNVADERFQFLSRQREQLAGPWIMVTRLFTEGPGFFLRTLQSQDDVRAKQYFDRLTRLAQVAERTLPAEKITGHDQRVDLVVEMFNQVNSAGTQLSKGDLSLAKLCASVPEARKTTRAHLKRWEAQGYKFRQDWLLRNIAAVATGRGSLMSLDAVTPELFQDVLNATPDYIDTLLAAIREQLGLDHGDVLFSPSAFPVLCRLLHRSNKLSTDSVEQRLALYWYVLAGLRGRYARSTQTILGRDLTVADHEGVDGLIADLESHFDDLHLVLSEHLEGANARAGAYPVLYAACRTMGARDLTSGTGLTWNALEHRGLEMRTIFPKTLLREAGYQAARVNAIGNLYLVAAGTNGANDRGANETKTHLGELETANPGVLESQWIPRDPDLWCIERYPEFLRERHRAVAQAFNQVLMNLSGGKYASD